MGRPQVLGQIAVGKYAGDYAGGGDFVAESWRLLE